MARVIIRRAGFIVFPEPELVIATREIGEGDTEEFSSLINPTGTRDELNYPTHPVGHDRMLHTIPVQPEILARQKRLSTYSSGEWLMAVAHQEVVALSVFVEANGFVYFQGCWLLDLSVFRTVGQAVNYIPFDEPLTMPMRNTGSVKLYWHSGDGECLHWFGMCNTLVSAMDTFNLVNLTVTLN